MANIESIFALGVILIFLFLYVIEIDDIMNVSTLGFLAVFLLGIVLFSNIA